MNGAQLAAVLRAGQRIYGTLITSPSPHWPPLVKATGLDFVFIDTEHIPIERTTLAWMCRTYGALDLAPVVRIPSPDPYEACVALDNGAAGVLAPYIETAAQVRALSGAVKWRPLKGQVLDDVLAGTRILGEPLSNYVRERNAGNVLLVNIESVPALTALDEILAVPGLDAVQIGPHDLSCSLGVPEQYGHRDFLDAVRMVIEKATARGVGVGVHFWESVEQEIAWARQGANLIVHSGDITLFTQALARDLRAFRDALGDKVLAPAGRAAAI